ncbi:hypothetical protein [Lentzea kentuckyensis]|uniref:hypothetical protein n=1 Tax=Lentzea kentuckyensis TaxID=360086 RepID=UPI00117AAC27|nr:hypothetical protein [Lentzea kentuckyensis]
MQTVNVHGRYAAMPNGNAPNGHVYFVAPVPLRVTADDTIVLPDVYPAEVIAGQFTIALPVTDDPAITPSGWTYEVVEALDDQPRRRYRIAVPRATVGTLELADVQPAVTPIPAVSYATSADIVALDARVDALEATPGGGVTDHGALTGLADDDHAQYFNAARLATALSPYATVAAVTTSLATKADSPHSHTQDQVSGLTATLASKADGTHTHVIGEVTGLTAALDSKAPTAHTHITADVTGLDAALAAKAAAAHTHTLADVTGLPAALSALATKPVVRTAYITSGNITPLPDTGGAWSRPGAANGLPADFTLDLPANVGDWVELGINAMKSDNTQAFFDAAVIVGATVVRYLASGTNTPAVEGDPAWYPPPYRGITSARGFVVEAGHLDGGNIRFILANKTSGAGALYASESFPFCWTAKNLGPVN